MNWSFSAEEELENPQDFSSSESENEAINTVKTVSCLPGYSLRFVDTEVKVL